MKRLFLFTVLVAALGVLLAACTSGGGTPTTYRLTLTVEGDGEGAVAFAPAGTPAGVCEDDCQKTFPEDTTVTLSVTPTEGSTASWGGACSAATGDTCEVVMDANKAVTVTFDGEDGEEPTVTSVTIEQEEVTVGVGQTSQLSATVEPEDADQSVTWMSDNTDVATVDPATGLVTGVTVGTATITATSTLDGTKSDSATVTVTEPSGPTITLDFLGSGAGQVFVNGTGPYTSDATVTVEGDTAILQKGEGSLIAWGGACSAARAANSCTLTMDGPKTVTAAFSSGTEDTASSRVTNVGLPSGSSDDVEEFVSAFDTFVAGEVYEDSGTLDLTYDPRGTDQVVGLRYRNLDIPQGATILNATIQFRSRAVSTDAPDQDPLILTIEAQDSANAPGFTEILYNVSSRARLDTSVSWTPATWGTGTILAALSPNLTTLVQDLVNKGDWDQANNAVAFIITSNDTQNRRAADSFESNPDGAPQLVIVYEAPAAP